MPDSESPTPEAETPTPEAETSTPEAETPTPEPETAEPQPASSVPVDTTSNAQRYISPIGESAADNPELAFRGLLRDLREKTQNLRRCLLDIQEKMAIADEAKRNSSVTASLAEASRIFQFNRNRIDSLLCDVRNLCRESTVTYEWYSDLIARIENRWERIRHEWPSAGTGQPQLDEKARRTASWLHEVVFVCAEYTIPSRVHQHLKNRRVGGSLDFHATFEDEVPAEEDRLKILKSLSRSPGLVSGIVDVENGVIYRASPKPWRRALSYIILLLFGSFGFLFTYCLVGLGSWGGFAADEWAPDNRLKELMIGYGFLVVGAIVHLAVDSLKQSREKKAGSLRAIDDWILWVHVKESELLKTVLFLWAGLAGLAFCLGKDQVTWYTAFLVGYSIDSFVDLFLQRFAKAVSSKTTASQKDLSGGA